MHSIFLMVSVVSTFSTVSMFSSLVSRHLYSLFVFFAHCHTILGQRVFLPYPNNTPCFHPFRLQGMLLTHSLFFFLLGGGDGTVATLQSVALIECSSGLSDDDDGSQNLCP